MKIIKNLIQLKKNLIMEMKKVEILESHTANFMEINHKVKENKKKDMNLGFSPLELPPH